MTRYIPSLLDPPGLALPPLHLIDLVTPIADGDGALGRRQVENGVLCAINAYLEMNPGDFIEVFFTSQERADAYKIIQTPDLDKPVFLTIHKSLFATRMYEDVHYRITRLNQIAEESPKQRILVLLTQPGGTDKDPGTIGHSELHQQLEQDVIDRGIDADRAKLGTWVTILPYPYMREHDKLELKWGGESIHHTVTKAEAETPTSNPINLFVSQTVIENAGSCMQLPVVFQPVDEAGNLPDENGRWSTPSYVDVDLDDSKLVEPFVPVADFETGEIDLRALNGRDVKVQVQTNRSQYKPGDLIKLTWAGKTVDNLPVPQTFDIPVLVPGATEERAVSYTNVKAIARGQAIVSYEVQTAGGLLYSKKTFIRVMGDLNPYLAPSIDKANGGYLPPNLPKVTASLPWYPGRTGNDLVILYIIAVRQGGGTEVYEDARLVGELPEGAPITRDIEGAVLERFDGLNITVLYEVHTDSVNESEYLLLTVGEPKKDLPAPILEGSTDDNVFDPDPPDREAIYQIPLILTTDKDRGTWYYQGFTPAGSTQGEFELTPGSAARPIRIPLRRELIDLNQGHTVRMFYNLTRNGKIVYSEDREVRIGTPLPTLLEPWVLEAPEGRLDPARYQAGFTVRVATTGLQAGDAIELTVAGRPGDGSSVPARQFVEAQPYIDFNIGLRITGANLGRVVQLSYKVVRLGQETPSKTLDLQIGELLPQHMPKPLLEGFDGEFLDIGGLKDTTKVLCDKWPFQGYGLPVSLSYVETRTDGTSRTRDQLVLAPHEQTSGLAYTADVPWLRECKRDSRLTVMLKVGLFREAMAGELIACKERVYTVRTGLDDKTDFDNYFWNGWVPRIDFPAEIVLEQGEYFVKSKDRDNYLVFQKVFNEIEIGERYEFSFQYKCPIASRVYIRRDWYVVIHDGTIPASNTWSDFRITFLKNTSPASPMPLYFFFGYAPTYPIGVTQLDNIRLRRITK